MPLSQLEAIAIGPRLPGGGAGWSMTGLCRSAFGRGRRDPGADCSFLYCAIAAWALCHLFSGRGAYLHFGAMLRHHHGAERLLRDHPPAQPRVGEGQEEEGRTADPKHGAMGRQRSVAQHLFHVARAVSP